MSRLQLALNVSDIDASVDFYERLFRTPVTKRRPGYANFAISDPPLKLVLIEVSERRGQGTVGALNHLGIEVETPAAVVDASEYLEVAGLSTTEEEATTCCYALQNKVWVADPNGAPWEVYTVLDDAPGETTKLVGCLPGDSCCGPVELDARNPVACC